MGGGGKSVKSFMGIHKVKTTFTVILRLDYIFTVLNFIDDMKVMVDKSAGALAQIKALSPNRTGNHCIIEHHALPV